MTPTIEFIFTYEELPQEIFSEKIDLFYLSSANILLTFAMANLDEVTRKELIKISCCVYDYKGDAPKWYIQCNGKFWLDDIDKYREENNLSDSISPEYRNEWYNSNQIPLTTI